MASRIEIKINQIKKTAHQIVSWCLLLLVCLAYAGTSDARNKTTQFGYDGYDLSSITDPLNRSVTLRTDAIGRTVSNTDPLNQRSINTIDNLDRVTSVTDPNNQNTGVGYDNNDNLTSVADANSHSTGFSYDDRNAVTGKTDALNQNSGIVYDNEHRIKQSTDRKNQQTNYTYDSLNRLRTVTYADNSSITHSYDAGNRVTLLADSQNGNISFVYDNLDRVTQVTSPKGVVNYTYDANGQRSTMSITGQPTQSYTYDKAGRLTRIDQAAGAINNNQAQNIQFTYDDAGRLTKTTYANGITRDNSFDDAGQLTGITYKKADGSVIGDLAYTYDANGRRTKNSGSLAKTDLPDTIAATSYDANNRLTTWGSQILSYDKNGNLTGDGINTYVWNARNQLIQIKDSTNTETASFTYDALGRRQTKTVNGVSTGFVYDGVNIVQELNGLNATQADTANIRASYVTAGIDQVLVQQSGTGSTATSLTYLADAIGSTIRLTNGTGDKVVDYSYDPYGNTRADAVINNAFQYTGRENDGNGLYYYRARYYSPVTHRFISEDPIGLAGGINGYGYVEGDPISLVDPNGLAVDGTFDRKTGTVTFRDLDTNVTVIIKALSGNGGYTNKSQYEGLPNRGPLPAGDYLIGNGSERLHEGIWYPLLSPNSKGVYGYRTCRNVRNPETGEMGCRNLFNIHNDRASNGCVTIYSSVPKEDPKFPYSKEFEQLKNLLNKTKPLVINGETYKGWLHVGG